MWVGSGRAELGAPPAWGPCQCRSWGAQLSQGSWGAPHSPTLQRNQSIINCVSPALGPACSRVLARHGGIWGRKRGFLNQGSCPVWGRGAGGEVLPQGCRDVGTMCAQEPGMKGSHVPGMPCFVPRALGPVQGWSPHPQPRKGRVWLCHEDHLEQRSRDACAIPWPGAPESPRQGLQGQDGTLQRKANTHPPKRATSLLPCVLASEPGGYHMPCSVHSIILPQALQPPW